MTAPVNPQADPRDADRRLTDPDSWVDLYGDYLFKFALARIRDASTAEDLVQETFLAALRGQRKFESRSSVRTWLVAILRHKIVDHIRKMVREQPTDKVEDLAEAFDDLFTTGGKWKVRPNKWADNPMKFYEQREFLQVFHRCLSALPPRLAQAFTLREMDEVATEELCKILNISATNSWVMLYRARMHLRRCLETTWLHPAK